MNGKKFLAVLLCAAVCLMCFSACTGVGELVSGVAAGEFPVDFNGVTISSRPQKVVVLSASLADVVLALGNETQLTAGAVSCTQDKLKDLQKVEVGDVAAITGLSPDLVLLDPSSAGAEQALKDAGLTVLNIAPAVNREDFERLYAQVSSALNGGGPGYDAGVACAQDIFLSLDHINRMIPKKDTVTTGCYLYDLEGSAVTGDMFGTTIMTYSGVTNIFGSLAEQNEGRYTEDDLRVSNPTVIFCRPGLKAEIMDDYRFRSFQAVVNDRVVEMDPSLMEWQGRTIVNAALAISGAAYPELLENGGSSESDPTSKIEENVNSALASAQPKDNTNYETLEQGQQSEEIYKMQARLEELKYLVDTDYDGYFGEHTAQCLKEFQRMNDLEETGIADPETQKRLFSTLAKDKDGNMQAMQNAPTGGPNGDTGSQGQNGSSQEASGDNSASGQEDNSEGAD